MESQVYNVDPSESEPTVPVMHDHYGRPIYRPDFIGQEAANPAHRQAFSKEAQEVIAETLARTEQRMVRKIEMPERTPETFQAAIAEQIDAVSAAVERYNTNEVNTDFVEAKELVARLTQELNDARRRLADEEAKGTLADRCRFVVKQAESALSGLVGSYGEWIIDQLLIQRFGQIVPRERLEPGTRRELRNHIRISCLREFLLPAHDALSKEEGQKLIDRANAVRNALDALAQHIDDDGKS
jgi:hypothetical protein